MLRPLMTCLAALFFGFAARADLITDWNTQALSAIRNESTAPPLAARNLAILHVAIHDAVNTVAHTHSFYFQNIVVTQAISDLRFPIAFIANGRPSSFIRGGDFPHSAFLLFDLLVKR